MKKQNVVNADVDYFQINTTLLCFPFFSLGQIWKEYSVIQYIDKFRTKLKYTILLLVALLVLYVGIKNGEVNVFRDVYGNSILQFYLVVSSPSYIYMYFLYSLLNLKTKFIGDLSLGTILIIGFHQTMILEISREIEL